ncbi:hypothetical protein [Zooshikella ganghwensis]|uniref:Uncharacterized protein n=1 Tax=Zooshikella ganghwensis TaxID=202772 RepID=A0A4P9VGM3_9GAMM|nr:hypothetical protein [Zooshikella ganghwensis]RDH41499.1 hypothetical protein B9G39_28190 [Zooshikella ganghwensis]
MKKLIFTVTFVSCFSSMGYCESEQLSKKYVSIDHQENIPIAWRMDSPDNKKSSEPVLFDTPMDPTHYTNEELGLKEVKPYLNNTKDSIRSQMSYVASMNQVELKEYAKASGISIETAKAFHDHSTKVLTRAGNESRRLYKAFCKKLLSHNFKKPVHRYEIDSFIADRDKSTSEMYQIISNGIDEFQALYPADYKTMFDGIQGSFLHIEHDDNAVTPDYWVKYYKAQCSK